MAFFWRDGFDQYANNTDLAFNYLNTSNTTINKTGGRFGGGCADVGGLFTAPLIYPFGTQTEVWASFAFQITNNVSGDNFLFAWLTDNPSGGNNTIENVVTYSTALGIFKLWTGDLTTVVGTATLNVVSGWHWADVHLKRDASAGVAELWIDDVQVINATGIDTKIQTSQNMVACAFGSPFSGTFAMVIDDIFIGDASTGRVGDSRIETLLATSDASPNQGTPNSGTTHYTNINEAQWSASDFITMPNTSGDIENFGFGSLSSTPSVVWGVKVTLISEKSDAGSYQLEGYLSSNGTVATGTATQLTTSWDQQSFDFDVDPHTSVAWNYAAVNALHAGFKVP